MNNNYVPRTVLTLLLLLLSLQSCPTLCNPRDGLLPGSSVPGILQARILPWDVMPSSRGSSQPRDRTQVSHIKNPQEDSLPLSHREAQCCWHWFQIRDTFGEGLSRDLGVHALHPVNVSIEEGSPDH